MTRLDYKIICADVEAGREHEVKNTQSHLSGRVLGCHRDYFDVSLGKGWQVWSREICEDAEPGLTEKFLPREPDYTI